MAADACEPSGAEPEQYPEPLIRSRQPRLHLPEENYRGDEEEETPGGEASLQIDSDPDASSLPDNRIEEAAPSTREAGRSAGSGVIKSSPLSRQTG